jgi:uncharacterized repeat protein (TIGR01451 family)
VINAGYFVSNNFNADSKVRIDNSAVTSEYILKNNWWGANPPSVAQFTGTNKINYEPWLTAANGSAVAGFAPYDISSAVNGIESFREPFNGAVLSNSLTHVTLNFKLDDIGYHNGTPLTYDLEISTAPDFSGSKINILGGTGYPRDTTISRSVLITTLPSGGNTYYWRVKTTDAYGLTTITPVSWNFTIIQPEIKLTLQADKPQASAGQEVSYTLSFENPSAQDLILSNVEIVAILPEDVYWDGRVNLSGITSGMGNVTVRAFSDIAGATPVASFTTTTGQNVDNSPTAWTPPLPAANNHTVRRFSVIFPTMPKGANGTFQYRTRVK